MIIIIIIIYVVDWNCANAEDQMENSFKAPFTNHTQNFFSSVEMMMKGIRSANFG